MALALSLPDSAAKPVILAATYAVVIFSIIVQGLTVKWVIKQTAELEGLGGCYVAPLCPAGISPTGGDWPQRRARCSVDTGEISGGHLPSGGDVGGEGGAKERSCPRTCASYSCLSASIGSRRAPRSAGKKPKHRPIAAEKPTASRITEALGANGIDSA